MGGKESEIEKGMYAGTLSIRVRDKIPDSFATIILDTVIKFRDPPTMRVPFLR